MQKVSYMGNGSTTEFYFNFPYFETSNVVVTKNDTPATGCDIIGNSGGPDADIPYIGGKVVFEVAPTSLDCITIARQLPLERIVDYQPIAQINPTTLNQDLNYLMEVIKDRKDELTDLTTKYEEIADKESTGIILARITAIHDEITDIDAKIRALGDIGTLQQRVTDLTTTVGGHTTAIGTLDMTVGEHTTAIGTLNTTVGGHTTSIASLDTKTDGLDARTTGMIDYVVESQAPTAQNNYTWYRKYKSGWVEQGGAREAVPNNSQQTISLPVPMRSKDYAWPQISNAQSGFSATDSVSIRLSQDGTKVNIFQLNNASATITLCWEVKGMSA